MLDTDTLVNTDSSLDLTDHRTGTRQQYPARDFAFWTTQAIGRSVSRYRDSLSSAKAFEPDLLTVEIAPATQSNRREEPTLELPAVFRKRVIGEKSVSTLQEWECAVQEINDGVVHALATSVIAREPEQNFLDIPLSEFQPSDRARLREGVLFRLIIGFVMKPNGQQSREALLYLRHQLPRRKVNLEPLLDVLTDD
jgi:hypothetical protein